LTGHHQYQRHREKRVRQQCVLCIHLDYVLTVRPTPPALESPQALIAGRVLSAKLA